MSATHYGVNAPEAVKLWSRRLAREALKETYIERFIGEGRNSLIVEKNDTKKDKGDRIRSILRMQLSGAGIQGDDTLEGAEEALTTYTDDFVINQLRHAVESGGAMSEQRIPFSVREEAMQGLKDWWSDRLDTWFFNHICGYTPQTDTKYTGQNAIVAPSASRQLWQSISGTITTDQGLQSTDIFNLSMIDKAVEKAKTATPLIRPIRMDGNDHYVMFLHPYQVTSLRTNTSNGQWLDIQKAAMGGGKDSSGDAGKNGVFTGSLGMYHNVILHESTRITQGVNSSTGAAVANTRRAVLCGANAVHIGFGQGHSMSNWKWVEKYFDYDNKLGVSAGFIGGLKKATWNSTDFGTIVCSSYAAAA